MGATPSVLDVGIFSSQNSKLYPELEDTLPEFVRRQIPDVSRPPSDVVCCIYIYLARYFTDDVA